MPVQDQSAVLLPFGMCFLSSAEFAFRQPDDV
jgi:hypothetical protein